MSSSIIHQATSETHWRILCLLRLGERRILFLKKALEISESAFSHSLAKLEELNLVETKKIGREKVSQLSQTGRILFSSLQALCFMLGGSDGTDVDDDSALVRCLREDAG